MYCNIKVRNILKEWKHKAFGNLEMSYIFAYTFKDGVLTVFSDHPGILIGKAGTTIDEYRRQLKEACVDIKKVHIEELYNV